MSPKLFNFVISGIKNKQMTDNPSPFEDPDSRSSGNIWGWKFSYISLAIILFMAALMYFRWIQLGKPSLRQPPAVEEQQGLGEM